MKKKKQNIGYLLIVTLLVLPIWTGKKFGHLDVEQIIFLMMSDKQGTTIDWPMIFSFFIFFVPIWLITLIVIRFNILDNFKITQKQFKYIIGFLLICTLFIYNYQFKITSFFKHNSEYSQLYENYYANPDSIKLTFPPKKRNLIYIYLESMEVNYDDIHIEGVDNSLIPHLKDIATKYTSFSHTDSFGGARQIKGTSWTAASLVAQTSGIPIQIDSFNVGFNEEMGFLPGVTTIGEILEKEGYRNYFLIGSDAKFGGRETYFKTHGNYEILDLKHYKDIGKLPSDYNIFWGYEDAKLFSYAKEELLEIAKSDSPFNFTMLTVDSHFTEGYTDLSCDFYFEEPYANAIYCSNRKVYDFVKWIQAQDFYENTTIILVGDHLTMNHKFTALMNNQDRRIYNAFINSNFKNFDFEYMINREFSVLDMFPTTLASLGVEIEGNRLGLGSNLMSNEKTLLEQMSIEELEEMISKKSIYYNMKFIE